MNTKFKFIVGQETVEFDFYEANKEQQLAVKAAYPSLYAQLTAKAEPPQTDNEGEGEDEGDNKDLDLPKLGDLGLGDLEEIEE